MRRLLLVLAVMAWSGSTLYAKDTVVVRGYYETSQYGTLNEAIDAARAGGTINNTVFKLTPYDIYVLSRSIFLGQGQNLEIVAPKPLRAGEADPQTVQNSAPPQIVWTEEAISRDYIIQTYGDVVMKNVWVRFDDISSSALSGSQRTTSITFEDSLELGDKERGYFEGCVFDYSRIGAEGSGSICVKADHFTGIFKDCYFRNISDFHYQYYGRAVSFPFDQTGFHYDSLLFENCTFSNLGRIVMQEAQSYGDNVHINHCTMINSVEWVYQTGRFSNEGWLRNASITNSIFVNPWMFGYRALDVCGDDQDYDDFLNGLCDPPANGGLISQIQPVDSFGFAVDWTDFDRKLFVGNIAYMYQDWLKAYYTECDWCAENIRDRHPEENYNPSPMISEDDIAFIDSMDAQGNKVFKKMNVEWSTVYDADPGFIVEPTNYDTLKLFLQGRWGTGLDIDWAYDKGATIRQQWPLPDNLAYNNAAYKTAAMGGFPLGDLNWYPDRLSAWEAQRDAEWTTINNWLLYGDPNGPSSVKGIPGPIPGDYVLNQNYPNPFNPGTRIEYSLPKSGYVSLKVYNLLGQEVATLLDGPQQAGNYVVTFDGAGLSSGVYMYRLESEGVLITKKLVLMK
jgi:hypothetical protein